MLGGFLPQRHRDTEGGDGRFFVLVYGRIWGDEAGVDGGDGAILGFADEAIPELGRGPEDVFGIDGGDVPCAFGDFGFELSGGPAGVSDEEFEGFDGVVDERFDGVGVGGEEHAVGDFHLAAFGFFVDDHEGAFAGAALEEGVFIGVGDGGDLGPGFGDGGFEGAVDDEAHGAVFVVLNDEDDGAGEVGVLEFARGDEDFAFEG